MCLLKEMNHLNIGSQQEDQMLTRRSSSAIDFHMREKGFQDIVV